METIKIIELFSYTLPAIITGGLPIISLTPILKTKKADDVIYYTKKLKKIRFHCDYKPMSV